MLKEYLDFLLNNIDIKEINEHFLFITNRGLITYKHIFNVSNLGLVPIPNFNNKVITKKSNVLFEIKLPQTSSVTPGYTVDSYIIISPFFINFDILIVDFFIILKSGFLFFNIGVGTVII